MQRQSRLTANWVDLDWLRDTDGGLEEEGGLGEEERLEMEERLEVEGGQQVEGGQEVEAAGTSDIQVLVKFLMLSSYLLMDMDPF